MSRSGVLKIYLSGVKKVEYKRLTKLSDLGTLHALDFNGEEQPLCELTTLDTDVLIKRLYELENKIESGELGDRKETAREILKPLYNVIMEHSDCCVNLSEDIKFLMEKYGIDLENEE